jgi:hypothetical protein
MKKKFTGLLSYTAVSIIPIREVSSITPVEIILRTRGPKRSLTGDNVPYRRTKTLTALDINSCTRRPKNYLQCGLFLVRGDPNTPCSGDYLPFNSGQIFSAVEIILRTRSPKCSLEWRLSSVPE